MVLTVQDEMFSKSGSASRITRLEKALLLLTFLLTLADVPLVTYAKGSNHQIGKRQRMTPDEIKSKLNESVDPCDDFYQFSCGGWLSSRTIPIGETYINVFSEVADLNSQNLESLLNSGISRTDSENAIKVKMYYKSCLDYDRINQSGVQPLKDFINREFGGWPLTTPNWQESSVDMTDLFIKLTSFMFLPIFLFYPYEDPRNASNHVLTMQQMGLSMDEFYYNVPRNDTTLMALEEAIYKYGMLLGLADVNTARQEAKDVVDFEIELASSYSPWDQYLNSSTWQVMTLAEVNTAYRQIMDWKRYFQTLMALPGIDVTDITDDEPIAVTATSYFEKVVDLFDKTPKRTIVNYMIWNVIKQIEDTQGQEVYDVMKEFNEILNGPPKQRRRHDMCLKSTNEAMGLALGKLFISDIFDAQSERNALDMTRELKNSFIELLNTNDWIDNATKAAVLEKNHHMGQLIGYPELINNETFMTEHYKDLIVEDCKFMENVLNYRKSYLMKTLRALRNPMDTPISLSLFDPLELKVNAHYLLNRNMIQLSASTFQPSLFHKAYPKYLNYGSIGSMIGHEITHGFDGDGRKRGKEGNLANTWSKEAVDMFTNKTQCLIDQYNNFTVEHLQQNVDGIRTLNENICDNGGLKQSYNAYRQWVSKNGAEDPLPGLRYTADQLFFINFGQMHCKLETDHWSMVYLNFEVHSPPKFRVIGSIQNLEDFGRVFNCPQNSAMNPLEKCSVW